MDWDQVSKDWTEQHSDAAQKEGWDLFAADGIWLQVQRIDNPDEGGPLSDDVVAWVKVRTGTGDHHRVARELVARHNPAEWKQITDYVGA